MVAVIGRNGVGKTTLVRSIIGLTPPRRGRILFKDTEITHMPAHRIARMGVGLVPQGRRIFPSLSVREHLEVAARRRGAGAMDARADDRAVSQPRARGSARPPTS